MANRDYRKLVQHLVSTGTNPRDMVPMCVRMHPEISYADIVAEIQLAFPDVELPLDPAAEEGPGEIRSEAEEQLLAVLFGTIVRNLKEGNSFEQAEAEAKILNAELAPLALKRVKAHLAKTNSWPYGGGVIGNDDPNPGWYGGPKPDSRLWLNLKSALTSEGRMTVEDIDVMDDYTTRTMALMPSPGRASFEGRGLVMGYVQSGKTTNFMGLAAKAADEGYKLIIVLSGITNNLRDQTQGRLEKMLTGGDPNWHWLTHEGQDFTTKHNAESLLGPQSHTRLIAVVKKNTSRLNLLHKWLLKVNEVARQNVPVLIIDDECDQATINTARQVDARTAVNKALRKLLDSTFLPRASYVGYSATPYANFLIDTTEDDGLYPKDFIVSLNKGKGYFGATELFGRDAFENESTPVDGADIIRDIPNTDVDVVKPPKGALDSWTPAIPGSLEKALGWFLIANSLRVLRTGKQDWSTMMVHTSPNVEPHRKTAAAIKTYLTSIREGDQNALSSSLNALYLSEIDRAKHLEDAETFEWEAIFAKIQSTLETLRVIVDNYKSEDRLDYNSGDPYPVVVVGGNTLARGLTLEGLVSSFFLRTSNAYDALMQMGRWFGYRPGYADLQRIWLANEDPYFLAKWFRDLAFVEEEIREQIDNYALEGKTPHEVGIKIRKLPGLAITSAAKQRHAVTAQISYSGSRIQTILFDRSEEIQKENIAALGAFVDSLKSPILARNADGWPVSYGVGVDLILAFMSAYKFEPGSKALQFDPIAEYINNLRRSGELEKWNVAFYNNSRTTAKSFPLNESTQLRMANRSQMKSEKDPNRIDIKTLISIGDMVADKPQLKDVHRAKYGPNLRQAGLQHLRNNDPELRGVPLLGIYIIDKDSTPSASESNHRVALNSPEHIVGLYFVFPETENPNAAAFFTANLKERAELEELDEGSEVIDEPQPINDDGETISQDSGAK